MIDFHTHVLFGLDDGANNIAESLKLIQELKSQGVSKIVLTPHYYFNNINDDGFFVVRKKNFEELKNALKDKDIELILACEVYMSKAREIEKFNIQGTRYILLELPFRTAFNKSLFERLYNIINYAGCIPVIAHAERYPAIHSKPEFIYQMIQMGCLIQVNTSSLFSESLKKLTFKMFKMEQVHCLGTDCHNDKRPPLYEKAKQLIIDKFGKQYFDTLQQNMNDILHNKSIIIPKTKPIKKLFGFYV